MNKNEQFVLASSVIENEASTQKERKNATVKDNVASPSVELYHENYY